MGVAVIASWCYLLEVEVVPRGPTWVCGGGGLLSSRGGRLLSLAGAGHRRHLF